MDVDGTLVNYETVLPESAVVAVRKARENGHKVYICTGRSESEVYDDVRSIGFDGMIGGNGTYVKDNDEVIFHKVLSKEDTRHIVDWLGERKLEFYLECNSGLFASEKFEDAGTKAIKEYSKILGQDSDKTTIRSVFPNMVFGGNLYRDDVNKISFVLNSYQDYLDSVKEFPNLNPGTWGGEGDKALFGDIGVNDIDKGKSVELLLNHIGADIADTFAFGDAKVDIPMLKKCAVGVAVASGCDEIKAVADYVTDAVDEDGIYNAFKHFGLI
ncbi:hypothetical protein SAMN05216249_1241 [Acetitomaculum ruminis DSM 5522]|uniref:Cof subfamily of IIB subfamily of haloacid dehalogenase superfamily/HAD-superfamily hydrolase, subfamily IIB n=2 Tax=Acetitomaculum ruminis TaxID=2382 RepID=A0A1I1AAV5_9FIRM|nr:hypothetical protein SAMN05216249_1241 [Acetitomaculum ruminis DSM 5522]